MRFVCDSCRAQYTISDDKVGAKGVKVRCKKCGYTITVRPAGATPAKDAASAPTEVGTGKGGLTVETFGSPEALGGEGLFSNVEEDEIGAVFDQVLSSGPTRIPAGESSSEAGPSDAVRKLAEAEEAEPVGESKPASAHEWFVAINEKQTGPLTLEKVKDYWERGEVGPDSLCWRAGYSDWIPLSEAKELASELAPQPPKPVIAAPVAPAPVAAAPTESLLGGRTSTRNEMPAMGRTSTRNEMPALAGVAAAGGLGRTSTRNEMPALAGVAAAGGLGRTSTRNEMPAAAAEEPSDWKPSAASVLASLVKEENEALSKPAPKPAVVEEAPGLGGLLDLPAPQPQPVVAQAPRTMTDQAMPVAAQYGQPAPYAPPAPAPYAPAAAAPYAPAAPAYPAPAPYAPPPPQPYAAPPAYAPQGYPPAAAPKQGRTGLMIGIAAGVVLLVGGGAAALLMRSPDPAPAQPVATAPAQPAGAEAAKPAEPAPAPVAAAPAAAAPAVTAPVAAAPSGTTPPAAAPSTPPPAQPVAAAPVAAAPPAVAEKPAEPVAKPPEPAAKPAEVKPVVARAEPPKSPSRTERGTTSRREEEPPPAPAPSKTGSKPSKADDEFDELFGTKPKKPEPAPKGGGSAYIPPEPGAGALPDKLEQSDIMQVVVANKPAIIKCVSEQKKRDSGLGGKLVMRWTIQTSGKTKNVSCVSDEFRSTYLATCLSGLIKQWTFPKHRVEGKPIDFPFTF